MRIVSGKWKGQRLVSFQNPSIRPMTDMVKETLFNILQSTIDSETRVLDLFCGSGSLGIEALSRGASHVTFVDSSVASLKVLQKNLNLLSIPNENFQISKSDAWRYLQGDLSGYNLIFIDPPFTKKWAHEIMEALDRNVSIPPSSVIVLQRSSREFFQDEYPALIQWKSREYSDKVLHIFVPKS